MLGPTVVATHSFSDAPALDVLFIPGGLGNRPLFTNNDTKIQDFIRERIDQVDYMASVCTGSAFLASAGVLAGRKATTNKASWAWVTQFGSNVSWVPSARWTQDGKVWTSSGVAAGMDSPQIHDDYSFG
jgi:putative intracellular protease/amidase